MDTWNGSLMLKSWTQTERAKVRSVDKQLLLMQTLHQIENACLGPLGLLPLTNGDSETDSLYDLEGKSRIIYY